MLESFMLLFENQELKKENERLRNNYDRLLERYVKESLYEMLH